MAVLVFVSVVVLADVLAGVAALDLSVLVFEVFVDISFTSDLPALVALFDPADLVVLVAVVVAAVLFVVLLVPQPAKPNAAIIAREAVVIKTFDAMFFNPFSMNHEMSTSWYDSTFHVTNVF